MKKILLLLPLLFLAPMNVEAEEVTPVAIENETPSAITEPAVEVETEIVTVSGITIEDIEAILANFTANLDPETVAEFEAIMAELKAVAGTVTDNVEGIRGWFTADNVILLVNTLIVVIFTAASVYLRVQVIAQKLFGAKSEEELKEAKARLIETEGQFTMVMGAVQSIGDTLTQVVGASKMTAEDKLKIQNGWSETKVRIQDFLGKQRERIEKYKDAIADAGASLMEVVGETKDVVEKYLSKDDNVTK
jgi:predicted  nucleic acid-binding Zn-ribbon protein